MLQKLTENYIKKEREEARGQDEVAMNRSRFLPDRRSTKVPISQKFYFYMKHWPSFRRILGQTSAFTFVFILQGIANQEVLAWEVPTATQSFSKHLTLIRPFREPNYKCSHMAASFRERSHSRSESVSTLLQEPRSRAWKVFLSFETSRFRWENWTDGVLCAAWLCQTNVYSRQGRRSEFRKYVGVQCA